MLSTSRNIERNEKKVAKRMSKQLSFEVISKTIYFHFASVKKIIEHMPDKKIRVKTSFVRK